MINDCDYSSNHMHYTCTYGPNTLQLLFIGMCIWEMVFKCVYTALKCINEKNKTYSIIVTTHKLFAEFLLF